MGSSSSYLSKTGKGYPLQYSGLENSMNYTVHGVTKSWTQLSDFHSHFLKKEKHVLQQDTLLLYNPLYRV